MEKIGYYFDQESPNWKKDEFYNQMFLEAQIAYFDQRLKNIGFVFLNEVLESLGLKRTRQGQVMGWSRRKHEKVGIFFQADINAEFLLKFEVEYILDDIDIIQKENK